MSTSDLAATPVRRVRLAAAVVFATFVLNGFTFANWLSRIPTIRDELGLEPQQLGLIILVGSLGSILALPVTGRILTAMGTTRTIVAASLVAAAGLGIAVTGVSVGQPLLLTAGLFCSTMGIGAWDVAMNFAGTRVEQALGRSIMPWFHGGFSIGTVAGAAVGGLAIRFGVGIPVHLAVVVTLAVVAVAVLTRGLLPDPPPEPAAERHTSRGGHLRHWTEGRTLLVGLVVLAAALTEGAANDWLALAIIDGFDTPNETGAFGLTVFLTAMTVMRFLGTFLLDRLGRVAVLRICTGLAIAGLAVFTLAPTLQLALVGAVLWGLGAALGFPVGMSAASDDPAKAAGRLSVVATIGYTAFLVGPGVLGLLAEHVGYRYALLAILVPLVVGLLVLPAAAPPTTAPEPAEAERGA